MAELLILRLHQPIRYTISTGIVPEGTKEQLEVHRASRVFDFSGPDGPEASLPGPESLILSAFVEDPLRSELCPRDEGVPHAELCPRTEESPSAELCPRAESGSYILPAGSYLFRQQREGPGFDLERALRDFVRDAWWERREMGDELIMRRVAEDGKTALQFLCRTVDSPKP